MGAQHLARHAQGLVIAPLMFVMRLRTAAPLQLAHLALVALSLLAVCAAVAAPGAAPRAQCIILGLTAQARLPPAGAGSRWRRPAAAKRSSGACAHAGGRIFRSSDAPQQRRTRRPAECRTDALHSEHLSHQSGGGETC